MSGLTTTTTKAIANEKSFVLPTATNWFRLAKIQRENSQCVYVCVCVVWHVTFDTQHDRALVDRPKHRKLWDAKAFKRWNIYVNSNVIFLARTYVYQRNRNCNRKKFHSISIVLRLFLLWSPSKIYSNTLFFFCFFQKKKKLDPQKSCCWNLTVWSWLVYERNHRLMAHQWYFFIHILHTEKRVDNLTSKTRNMFKCSCKCGSIGSVIPIKVAHIFWGRMTEQMCLCVWIHL